MKQYQQHKKHKIFEMICPRCAGSNTKVYGTRKGLVNIRFRECLECKYKFMTKEVPTEDLLTHNYNNYLEDIGEIDKEIRQKIQKED